MAATWFLGPAGDMRALYAPEPNIDISDLRYGGVFQGLSGASSTDVTGFRQKFAFEFKNVDPDEFVWYEALYQRLIPGPLRMLNPMKKNRLTPESSGGQWGGGTVNGLALTAGSMAKQWDWPSGAGTAGLVTSLWSGRTSGSVFRADDLKRTVVQPGETIVASAFLKAATPHTFTLALDWSDRFGTAVGASTTNAVSVTSSWQRFLVTAAVPAGAHLVKFAGYSFTTNSISVGPLQLETGSTPTSWEMGGGAPVVTIDQMSVVTPRYPLRNISMSILEV